MPKPVNNALRAAYKARLPNDGTHSHYCQNTNYAALRMHFLISRPFVLKICLHLNLLNQVGLLQGNNDIITHSMHLGLPLVWTDYALHNLKPWVNIFLSRSLTETEAPYNYNCRSNSLTNNSHPCTQKIYIYSIKGFWRSFKKPIRSLLNLFYIQKMINALLITRYMSILNKSWCNYVFREHI